MEAKCEYYEVPGMVLYEYNIPSPDFRTADRWTAQTSKDKPLYINIFCIIYVNIDIFLIMLFVRAAVSTQFHM